MEDLKLILRAGNHTRKYCPVSAEVQPPKKDQQYICLIDIESGEHVPNQCDLLQELGRIRVHWTLENLGKGEEKEYALRFGGKPLEPSERPSVIVEENAEGRLNAYVRGELFVAYNFGEDVTRPFVYPVYGPNGRPVTRSFPMVPDVPGETKDHPHHRSLWTAHGDVNGVDDWSESANCGKIIHRSFKKVATGPVYGEIETENDWVSHQGEKVLEEERRLIVYNTPEDIRLMDLEVNFKAKEKDVKFGDTKEGGIISVRVASSMDVVNGGQIENAYGGVDEEETWGKRAHWCDYSGPVGDSWIGIAIFDHPSNFRHPTYWHVRDYGLMTANPFGISYFTGEPKKDGSFTLKGQESLRFRYRVFIHSGNAESEHVKERYHDFVNPPKVTVS